MPRPKDLLSKDDMAALLRGVNRGPTGVRNMAAVTMMWRSGARASEISNLHPKDFDFDNHRFRIHRGKGDKPRTLGLDSQAENAVKLWLVERAKLAGVKNESPLFCTLQGGEVKRWYWWQMVKRLAKNAGLAKRVHPHAFRHAFTVELMVDGYHAREIQLLLGHASLDTTMVYMESLGDATVLAKMAQRT